MQLHIGIACNRHAAMFVRVLELPVTAFDAHKSPAIGFNELYNISYSHQPSGPCLVGLDIDRFG
jgi:hypothetical protein